MSADDPAGDVAFVLGGGGPLGAHEVGMLRALAEHGVRPDMILGTSVGAINGALFAADPTTAGVERLAGLWRETNLNGRSSGAVLRRATTLARSGTHLQSLTELRDRLVAVLPVTRGKHRSADHGERMSHVMPPQPSGALAAIRARRDADVIFSAHTGLGLAAYPSQFWRDMPIGRTLRTRMWLVPAADVPATTDEQVAWLSDWWKRIDEWIDAQAGDASAPCRRSIRLLRRAQPARTAARGPRS
jgi:Patatin-like phospholipase